MIFIKSILYMCILFNTQICYLYCVDINTIINTVKVAALIKEIVKDSIDNILNVNVNVNEVYSKLFQYTKNNNISEIENILYKNNFIDINKKDLHGDTFSHIACRNNYIILCNMYMSLNNDIEIKNYNGETIIYQTVKYGNIDSINNLINNHKVNMSTKNYEGKSLMHVAFFSRYDEVFKFIVDNKFNMDELDNNHKNILDYVFDVVNNISRIHYLLNNTTLKLSIIKYDYYKKFTYFNDSIIIKYLLNNTKNIDSLINFNLVHIATKVNNVNLLKLYTQKISINTTDIDGFNALYYAYKYNSTEALIYLIKNNISLIVNKNTHILKLYIKDCNNEKLDIIHNIIGVTKFFDLVYSMNIYNEYNKCSNIEDINKSNEKIIASNKHNYIVEDDFIH